MKFPYGVEISGVARVVIDRDDQKTWIKMHDCEGYDWKRCIVSGPLSLVRIKNTLNERKTPQQMTQYIQHLLSRTHRAFFKEGTLNIVRRDEV